jgi:hypothetical protein
MVIKTQIVKLNGFNFVILFITFLILSFRSAYQKIKRSRS